MGQQCHTAATARKMAISIADTMRSRLIKKIQEDDVPISIILGNNL